MLAGCGGYRNLKKVTLKKIDTTETPVQKSSHTLIQEGNELTTMVQTIKCVGKRMDV